MQVIEIIDTATAVRITHRALPALLKAIFFSTSLAFVAFVLANVDLVTLDIVTRAGRKIEVAEASLDEAEFDRFIDAARRVRARMKIPYEVAGLPSRAWGWRYPPWWNTQV